MELRNINTFLHIAELHSFSRTARQLGYSQSAVSSQIAQLEAELGAPLFDRVGKTVRLTGAGETFLGYARTLLATVEQAQAALQLPQQISGRLRIALADSVCSTFLPDLLQRYHAQFPQVELVLCTATDDGMLQMLTTNQVDLAYTLDHPLLQPTLVRAVDVPEPVCFIAPAGHPLAAAMHWTSVWPPTACNCSPIWNWAAPRCCARWWSGAWAFPFCRNTSCVPHWPPGHWPG